MLNFRGCLSLVPCLRSFGCYLPAPLHLPMRSQLLRQASVRQRLRQHPWPSNHPRGPMAPPQWHPRLPWQRQPLKWHPKRPSSNRPNGSQIGLRPRRRENHPSCQRLQQSQSHRQRWQRLQAMLRRPGNVTLVSGEKESTGWFKWAHFLQNEPSTALNFFVKRFVTRLWDHFYHPRCFPTSHGISMISTYVDVSDKDKGNFEENVYWKFWNQSRYITFVWHYKVNPYQLYMGL